MGSVLMRDNNLSIPGAHCLDPAHVEVYMHRLDIFREVVEKYEDYLKSNSAEIAHIDHWGMRVLAYTSSRLKERRQGYYVLFQFTAEPSLIPTLERELSLDEGVLRHLVVGVRGEFMRVPQLVPESALFQRPDVRRREEERRRRADSDDQKRDEVGKETETGGSKSPAEKSDEEAEVEDVGADAEKEESAET